jgi:hypothetical protein
MQHNGHKKKDKRTNNDLQSIHIKLKIEQHEHHLNPVVNAGGLEGLEVPAPHLTPVVLLSYDTNIIWYGNRVGHQYT